MRRAFDHLPELIEAARAFEESHPFRTKPVAGQRAMLLGVVVDERAPEAVRLHLAVEVQPLTVVEGTIAETAAITRRQFTVLIAITAEPFRLVPDGGVG
jgi:hypothetical protein